MIASNNFIDVASVHDLKINESDLMNSNFTNTDPLGGVATENQEEKQYRLQEIVFAEPLSLPKNINKDKPANEELVFLDNIVIPKTKFESNKHEIVMTNSRSQICHQPDCNRRFSSLILLKAHVRKVHCADRTKYQCSICDAAFPQKYQLNRHMTIHESIKKECPVCYKKLSSRTNMTLHMRGHGEKRLHTCPKCEKKFIRKVTMDIHIRYVHRIGSLKCGRCDVTFQRRIDFKRHLDTHIKLRNVECEICGRMFSTLAALGAHKVKKHEVNIPACKEAS